MDGDIITAVIRSIVGTGALLLLGACTKSIRDIIKTLRVVKKAQRTMLKNEIVKEYELAESRGYISTLRLEVCERAFEDYKALKGNSYIEDLMTKLRTMTVIPITDTEKQIAENTKEGV